MAFIKQLKYDVKHARLFIGTPADGEKKKVTENRQEGGNTHHEHDYTEPHTRKKQKKKLISRNSEI